GPGGVAGRASTGSVGGQALEAASRDGDRRRVTALAAGHALDALCRQALVFHPQALALEHPDDPAAARAALESASPGASVWLGPGSAARVAAECDADVVVNGIVGARGLAASLATLD